MPSRNILKDFVADSFYHLFNRGVEKRQIFYDDQDYTVFLGLLKKYLSGENHNKNNRHKTEKLGDQLDLLAYCLMPSHFHLLIYQKNDQAMTKLMRRVMTGYVMYFNNRYQRVGGLFQGRYKASLINADDYLHHISRYIHLNPQKYIAWPYSSLPYYLGAKKAPWLNTKPILNLFDGNKKEYAQFLKDYEDTKQELDPVKWQLADISETM